MNLTLCLDNETANQAEPLSPHKNLLDIHNPRKLSGIAAIPKPVVSTIAHWLHRERDLPIEDHHRAFLNSIAI
jgi:hypothetical protein